MASCCSPMRPRLSSLWAVTAVAGCLQMRGDSPGNSSLLSVALGLGAEVEWENPGGSQPHDLLIKQAMATISKLKLAFYLTATLLASGHVECRWPVPRRR